MKEIWFLWLDGALSSSWNMAIDEQCLYHCSRLRSPILRLYGWDYPSISIGYSQRYEKNISAIIVRRPTGGGTVFHGQDVTYSLACPSGHWLHKKSRLESYCIINDIIRLTLKKFSIDAIMNDCNASDSIPSICFDHAMKYDLLFQGKKIAGAAQWRHRKGFLHQGSVYMPSSTPSQRNSFRYELASQMQRSFCGIFQTPEITPDFFRDVQILVEKRYNNNQWNKKR